MDSRNKLESLENLYCFPGLEILECKNNNLTQTEEIKMQIKLCQKLKFISIEGNPSTKELNKLKECIPETQEKPQGLPIVQEKEYSFTMNQEE